jgi:S-(hydroxymethyl)glutathione dehydrogenase / alcohol dehydrogenase
MKAAICYEFGKPLVMEDVELDPPSKGEVKIRLAATAICHSDIHAIRGELGPSLPTVVGHESAGFVEEVGEGVTRVKPGDAVVVSLLSSCGKCDHCVRGLPHLCDDKSGFKKPSPLKNKQGQRLNHGFGVSGFAEYVIVSESQVVPVPEEIPLDRAALLGCGVITGFGAVINRAQVKATSSVVVIGVGGVGLNSVQGAAISGAYPIIAVDVSDAKLEDARVFGATHTVNSRKEDAVKAVQQLTNNKGADFVFVAVGNIDAIRQGIAMSTKRGMTVAIGLPPAQQLLSFSPLEFIATEKILTAVIWVQLI